MTTMPKSRFLGLGGFLVGLGFGWYTFTAYQMSLQIISWILIAAGILVVAAELICWKIPNLSQRTGSSNHRWISPVPFLDKRIQLSTKHNPYRNSLAILRQRYIIPQGSFDSEFSILRSEEYQWACHPVNLE